jgi:hypothetical protein
MPQHTRATVRYSVSTAFGKSFAGVAVRHALASTIGVPFATHRNRRKRHRMAASHSFSVPIRL